MVKGGQLASAAFFVRNSGSHRILKPIVHTTLKLFMASKTEDLPLQPIRTADMAGNRRETIKQCHGYKKVLI
jgi:hypothetical protein